MEADEADSESAACPIAGLSGLPRIFGNVAFGLNSGRSLEVVIR